MERRVEADLEQRVCWRRTSLTLRGMCSMLHVPERASEYVERVVCIWNLLCVRICWALLRELERSCKRLEYAESVIYASMFSMLGVPGRGREKLEYIPYIFCAGVSPGSRILSWGCEDWRVCRVFCVVNTLSYVVCVYLRVCSVCWSLVENPNAWGEIAWDWRACCGIGECRGRGGWLEMCWQRIDFPA